MSQCKCVSTNYKDHVDFGEAVLWHVMFIIKRATYLLPRLGEIAYAMGMEGEWQRG